MVLLTLTGQHFVPKRRSYEPLDFLEVAVSEKIERDLAFMIVVTEVELASKNKSYLMAMENREIGVSVKKATVCVQRPIVSRDGEEFEVGKSGRVLPRHGSWQTDGGDFEDRDARRDFSKVSPTASLRWIAKRLETKSAANVSQQLRTTDAASLRRRLPNEFAAWLERSDAGVR